MGLAGSANQEREAMKTIVAFLLLATILLAACTYPAGSMSMPYPEDIEAQSGCTFIAQPVTSLWRCVDQEAGVVCYLLTTNGVFCMPLEDTDLEGYQE
jgi:hypothetical protein